MSLLCARATAIKALVFEGDKDLARQLVGKTVIRVYVYSFIEAGAYTASPLDK